MARLAIRLQYLSKNICSLDAVISGSGFDEFDDVIKAIDAECRASEDDTGRWLFKNPNLALKVGHSLLKLGHLKLGAAIRSKNADAKADAEAFIARYLNEFTDTVSDAAHASVKRMPCRLDEFPDFARLKEFQQTTSERLCKELASMPSKSLWRELAELTMSRILVFNARRGKEVTDLKLSGVQEPNKLRPGRYLGLNSCE